MVKVGDIIGGVWVWICLVSSGVFGASSTSTDGLAVPVDQPIRDLFERFQALFPIINNSSKCNFSTFDSKTYSILQPTLRTFAPTLQAESDIENRFLMTIKFYAEWNGEDEAALNLADALIECELDGLELLLDTRAFGRAITFGDSVYLRKTFRKLEDSVQGNGRLIERLFEGEMNDESIYLIHLMIGKEVMTPRQILSSYLIHNHRNWQENNILLQYLNRLFPDLINEPAEPDRRFYSGQSALHEAVLLNAPLPLLKDLIREGGNWRGRDRRGLTALQVAVVTGNCRIVRELLGLGVSIGQLCHQRRNVSFKLESEFYGFEDQMSREPLSVSEYKDSSSSNSSSSSASLLIRYRLWGGDYLLNGLLRIPSVIDKIEIDQIIQESPSYPLIPPLTDHQLNSLNRFDHLFNPDYQVDPEEITIFLETFIPDRLLINTWINEFDRILVEAAKSTGNGNGWLRVLFGRFAMRADAQRISAVLEVLIEAGISVIGLLPWCHLPTVIDCQYNTLANTLLTPPNHLNHSSFILNSSLLPSIRHSNSQILNLLIHRIPVFHLPIIVEGLRMAGGQVLRNEGIIGGLASIFRLLNWQLRSDFQSILILRYLSSEA